MTRPYTPEERAAIRLRDIEFANRQINDIMTQIDVGYYWSYDESSGRAALDLLSRLKNARSTLHRYGVLTERDRTEGGKRIIRRRKNKSKKMKRKNN